MIGRAVGAVAIGFAAAGAPNAAAAGLNLIFGTDPPQDGSDVTLTLGTAGMNSQEAGSRRPAKGNDPYYFNIPSERPAESAPGFIIHIPFGNDSSR